MRKIYWLLTPLVFGLGVALGIFCHIFWQSYWQPGTNTPDKTNAAKVSQTDTNLYALPDSGDQDTVQTNGLPEDHSAAQIAISKPEQDKLLADYKQSIGILFEAWKEKDVSVFREKLAGAYTGEILESHAQRAEKYLAAGVGIHVCDIVFDHIGIESADNYSATINAIYRYTSQDYDLDKKYHYGEKFSHFVHVRANLVKIDSKWMITSETVL